MPGFALLVNNEIHGHLSKMAILPFSTKCTISECFSLNFISNYAAPDDEEKQGTIYCGWSLLNKNADYRGQSSGFFPP
jgi:hypothetical protein